MTEPNLHSPAVTMTLDDMFNNVPPPTGKQCRLDLWLGTLNEADQNAFWRAIDNEEIPTRHIWRVVKTIGCPNQESSIRSHRRGECKTCERKIND